MLKSQPPCYKHSSSGYITRVNKKLVSSPHQDGKITPDFGDSQAHIAQADSHSCAQVRRTPQSHQPSGYRWTPSILPRQTWRWRMFIFLLANTLLNTVNRNICTNVSPCIPQKCKEPPGPCEMNVHYTKLIFTTVHIRSFQSLFLYPTETNLHSMQLLGEEKL